VSAQQAPIIDWPAADAAARRRDVDVLLFGPRSSRSEAHYSESVVVDHDGRVLRFRRHYFDSSASAAKWAGPPGFMTISAKHATPVVNHLIACGWGMDSIGALALNFTLCWAESPCVLGAGRGAQAPDAAASAQVTNDLDSFSPSIPLPTSEVDLEDDAAAEEDPAYLFLKRSLDFIASAIGLVVLSPLLLTTALAIKLTSRGPVLFGHRRQGVGGGEFTCWKFRSMRVGADAMQAKLRALNEVDGPQFKIKADPRITPIGAFLRKSNIDELPQLINVLLGQMSLVGPRPSPDRENQLCPAWRRARLSVKPGITGLWQVLRRRDEAASDFQEWIYYDVEYAKHRSLWLDIRILLYTPVAILAPKRASALARKLQKFGVCAYSPRICQSAADLLPQVPAQASSTALAHSSPVGNGSGLSSWEGNEC
jgi:lipopolysaccharide/colanic/teichoic acid biosynthesis glycosyltransferase